MKYFNFQSRNMKKYLTFDKSTFILPIQFIKDTCLHKFKT